MHFSLSAATAALALAVSVAAQQPDFDPVTSPSKGQKVPVGQPVDIRWTCHPQYKDVTVKIVVISGETQNGQVPVQEIASSVSNSAERYSWTPDKSLPEKPFYGLKIIDVKNETLMQYSEPFLVVGGSAAASSSLPATSISSAIPYGTPVATSASVPAVPTGVAPQGNVPVACGSGVSNGSAPATPATGSNNDTPGSNNGAPGSNGGAPGSNGGAPGSNGGAPGSNGGAPGSNGGAPGSSNGGTPSPETGATPNGSAPGSNSYPGSNGAPAGPASGVSSGPNNSTIPVTGAAPVAQVGLLGVFGAAAVVALSL